MTTISTPAGISLGGSSRSVLRGLLTAATVVIVGLVVAAFLVGRHEGTTTTTVTHVDRTIVAPAHSSQDTLGPTCRVGSPC